MFTKTFWLQILGLWLSLSLGYWVMYGSRGFHSALLVAATEIVPFLLLGGVVWLLIWLIFRVRRCPERAPNITRSIFLVTGIIVWVLFIARLVGAIK